MKNVILTLLIALGFFLAIYFYRQYALTQSDLALANQRILDRDRLIYTNQKQLDALRSQKSGRSNTITDTGITVASRLGTINATDIARLQKRGLNNPEADLKSDLIEKQDVLLPKGSVGGTMAIREVKILNDRYAYAYFEDGHNGGYMLLLFSIEPTKRIAWKVLDYYTM